MNISDIRKATNQYIFLYLVQNKDAYDLLNAICECRKNMDNFMVQHSIIFELIHKINNCKNELWNAEFNIDYNGNCRLSLYINICSYAHNGGRLYKIIHLSNIDLSDRENIIHLIEKFMKELTKESERLGYRIWLEGRN